MELRRDSSPCSQAFEISVTSRGDTFMGEISWLEGETRRRETFRSSGELVHLIKQAVDDGESTAGYIHQTAHTNPVPMRGATGEGGNVCTTAPASFILATRICAVQCRRS